MYEIPTKVSVNGKDYPITNKGDYRMVLACIDALDDTDLTSQERTIACLMIFYEDFNSIFDVLECDEDTLNTLVLEVYKFINCGKMESPGMKVNYKLIDWSKDSQLICSAINKVSGTEIRALPYLHWWTFMGYYLAVGESSLSTVVGIRHKMIRGKKLEKYEREFVNNNPDYFEWNKQTTEDRELEELANLLWEG